MPIVIRLLPDGTPDSGFGFSGTVDGGLLGLGGGRATGLLLRSDGTVTFTVGSSPTAAYPSTFTTVRVLSTGGLDVRWGGSGIVSVPLGPNQAGGIGAADIAAGPGGTTIVAGTDLTGAQTPRGAVLRLRPDGTLDSRFGTNGITRHLALRAPDPDQGHGPRHPGPDPARRLGRPARVDGPAPARERPARQARSATAA